MVASMSIFSLDFNTRDVEGDKYLCKICVLKLALTDYGLGNLFL